MADPRFFSRQGPFTLAELAEHTGATLSSPAMADRRVSDVAPLDRAELENISFLDNPKYVETFRGSRTGACFVRERYAEMAPSGMALLLTEDPYRCYALTAQRFYPVHAPGVGISPSAIIDKTAKIGEGCRIEHGAVIGPNVEIGKHCSIGANTVLHEGVRLGSDARIGALCSISHCYIGNRVIIHRGVHIGQDGFGFAMNREGHVKVPQLGRVMIEDDVEIGAGTCIDRGTGPDTLIGAGSKIDNLVQIGHNVQIGRNAVIVAQSGIAGSTRIGDGAVLGGQVGISGHVKIGPGVKIAAKSGVMGDVPAGASYGGSPAVPVKDWHRQTIAIARLARMRRSVEE
jgi:UDP-3-O-[3-hydroxymyristoyl] glucosamine N-acyltransferase